MFLQPHSKSQNRRQGTKGRTLTGSFRGGRKQRSFVAAGLFLATALAMSSQAADAKYSEQRYARHSDKAEKALLLDVTRTASGPRMVTVGDRGHILFSDDNGLQWQQAKVPTIQMLTAVTFPSQKIGYAVGHDAIILKSEDGGENWVKLYDDLKFEAPLLDVWFADELKGVAVGAYGSILRTTDGGKSWKDIRENIDNEEELHYNAISSDGGNNVYIAGEAGMLFRSKDLGASWERLDSPYEGSWFGITANSREVLVHGLRGNLFRSTDEGGSWKPVASGATQTLFGSTQLDNGQSIVVGNAGSFLTRTAGNWKAVNRSDRMTLNALTAGADGSVVAVGQGGIYRMSTQGEDLAEPGTLEKNKQP